MEEKFCWLSERGQIRCSGTFRLSLNLGKYAEYRYELCWKAETTRMPHFFIATTAGAQDGYDGEVIFDGRSMAPLNKDGKLPAQGKAFDEDFRSRSYGIQPNSRVPNALISKPELL